jgi:hypothetical protein
MSAAGGLDLRLPIGGLFVMLGLVLAGYGIATNSDAAQYAKSGGLNINLWWGVVMLVVGILFLLGARRGAARDRAAADTAARRP